MSMTGFDGSGKEEYYGRGIDEYDGREIDRWTDTVNYKVTNQRMNKPTNQRMNERQSVSHLHQDIRSGKIEERVGDFRPESLQEITRELGVKRSLL